MTCPFCAISYIAYILKVNRISSINRRKSRTNSIVDIQDKQQFRKGFLQLEMSQKIILCSKKFFRKLFAFSKKSVRFPKNDSVQFGGYFPFRACFFGMFDFAKFYGNFSLKLVQATPRIDGSPGQILSSTVRKNIMGMVFTKILYFQFTQNYFIFSFVIFFVQYFCPSCEGRLQKTFCIRSVFRLHNLIIYISKTPFDSRRDSTMSRGGKRDSVISRRNSDILIFLFI